MNGITKFLLGAGATALMALVSHSALGSGERFVKSLETQAAAALASDPAATGLRVVAQRSPALARVLTIDGAVPAADRARLEALALAVPGVKAVRWADGQAAAVSSDAASGAAEAPATAAAAQSCQEQVNAVIAGKTINFASGSAMLRPESEALIAEIAAILAPCSGTRVEVAGHTDLTGDDAANLKLSEQRANIVMATLVNQAVPAARITATGYGSTRPLQPGRGAAANAANRRIEFLVASTATATETAP